MNHSDSIRKDCRVLVVGPGDTARGGVSSVIAAHRRIWTWSRFGCRLLNTFADGGVIRKCTAALCSYVRVPLLLAASLVVHIHTSGPTSMARKLPIVLLAKLMRRRLILHLHAPDPAWLFSRRPRWLFRVIARQADCLIALSPWWAAQLSARGVHTPIRVIPNPVTLPPASALCNTSDLRPVVLFAGKLEARKGYSDLIEAAAIVLEAVPSTEFVLAGDGLVSRAGLQAKRLGIGQAVRLTGWLSAEELSNLYRRAMIFCLPSYGEGVPVSLLEAMSWGLPVVTTPVGGIPDVVADGVNGLLVTPGDIASIAGALIALLTSSVEERRRLGLAARNTVHTRCNPAMIADQIADLYDEVLKPRIFHGSFKSCPDFGPGAQSYRTQPAAAEDSCNSTPTGPGPRP